VWSFVVLFVSCRVLCGAVRVVCLCVTCFSSCRVVCGAVLFLLCVCVCDRFLFSQDKRTATRLG